MTRFGVLWPYSEGISPHIHAQSIKNTGCKEVRLQFCWDQVETRVGDYQWGVYDRLVEIIRSVGLGVLPIVYRTPRWHKPSITDPPETPVYSNFLVKVAQRYSFPAYEIWNEPNWRYSKEQPLDWGGTFDQYADLYREAREALHQYDASFDAVVGGLAYVTGWPGQVSGTPSDFLDWIWNRIGPLDAVALHPYGFGPDPVADTMAKTKQMVSFLNSKGASCPVDLTEIGMTVPPEPEKKRSAYLKSFAAKIKDWKRVRRVTVFTWYGAGENEKWSIAKQDGNWKGSASGYAAGIKAV